MRKLTKFRLKFENSEEKKLCCCHRNKYFETSSEKPRHARIFPLHVVARALKVMPGRVNQQTCLLHRKFRGEMF